MSDYSKMTKAQLEEEIRNHECYDNNDLSQFSKQDMVDWLTNADMND